MKRPAVWVPWVKVVDPIAETVGVDGATAPSRKLSFQRRQFSGRAKFRRQSPQIPGDDDAVIL